MSGRVVSDTAPNIADRLVAVKTFADRTVRTNDKRVLSNSCAESIFLCRIERIKFGNEKAKFRHLSREVENGIGKFFHRQAKIGVSIIKVSKGKN